MTNVYRDISANPTLSNNNLVHYFTITVLLDFPVPFSYDCVRHF